MTVLYTPQHSAGTRKQYEYNYGLSTHSVKSSLQLYMSALSSSLILTTTGSEMKTNYDFSGGVYQPFSSGAPVSEVTIH